MNVLLVAEEAAGIHALRLLAGSGHRLVAVLTAPPTTGGGATVAAAARRLGARVLPSARVRDAALAGWLAAERVDLLLNVHSLHLIHADVVAAPAIGSFNLHPGPLPEYAGLNAPSWAIYNGERAHGVTLHWMEPAIDTGPVAYEERFELGEDETGLAVSSRCVRLGLPLVERLLAAAAADPASIPRRPQDLERRRYYGRAAPQGGRVDWARPAREIAAFVRACDYGPFPSPWGRPLARLGSRDVAVLAASHPGEPAGAEPGTVGRAATGGARLVAGADEWIAVERIAAAGGRAVAADELLRAGARLAVA